MSTGFRARYGLPGLIPFVLAAVGFLTLLKAPYTGMTFLSQDGAWYVSETVPGSPSYGIAGLEGARVTGVGDFALEPFDLVEDFDYIPDRQSLVHWWQAQRYFSDSIRPGGDVEFTVDPGVGETTVSIRPETMTPLHILSHAGLMFFIGLFSLVVGLSVVFRKPEDIRARLFFFMVFSVATIFVTFGSYTSREIAFDSTVFLIFRVCNVVAFAYFPVLFFHFCLVFPRERKISRSRLFRIVLYLLPVAVSALYQPRISYLSLNLLFMAGLLAGIVSIVHGYFTAQSVLEKYQIRWVLWGIGVFVAVFLLTTFIPILFNGQRLFGDRVPSFFFIFIPLSMAFAITRYHLMDIESIFDTTIIYALTLGVIAGLDYGVMAFLARLKDIAIGPDEPRSTIIALWFAVLAYIPVRNAVNSGVKRLLKREVYDAQETAMTFGNRLLSAQTVDDIVRTAIVTIEGLFHPKGHTAIVFTDDFVAGESMFLTGERDSGIDIQKEARRWNEPTPFWRIETGDSHSGVTGDSVENILIPLKASAGTVGGIVLRSKQSGKLYNTRDMRLLNTIATQTAMALESVFRKEEGNRLERDARRERERISREIHDGIGSSFSNSIMLLNMIEKEGADTPVAGGRLTRLKQVLAGGLSELRDLVWTIEEKDYRLGDLVSHIQEKVRVMIGDGDVRGNFIVAVENEQLPLSAMIRLNTIRIVQESIANALKHSGADDIVVEIENIARDIKVAIRDNGHGFDTGSSMSAGYGLRNIAKRCEEMGGECTVTSEPGRGTVVSVFVIVPETVRDHLSETGS